MSFEAESLEEDPANAPLSEGYSGQAVLYCDEGNFEVTTALIGEEHWGAIRLEIAGDSLPRTLTGLSPGKSLKITLDWGSYHQEWRVVTLSAKAHLTEPSRVVVHAQPSLQDAES